MIVFSFSLIAFISFLVIMLFRLGKKRSILFPAIAVVVSFWVGIISLFTAAILDSDVESEEALSDSSEQKEVVEASDDTAVLEAGVMVNESSIEASKEAPKEETSASTEAISNDESYFEEPEASLKSIENIDTAIADVLIEKGYSIEHASSIQEILNIVGIDTIEIQHMTGEPEKGLNSVVAYPNGYTDDDRRFYFTTEDGVLFYAGFTSEDLYDLDKGGFLKNYNDVHVPEKEVTWDEFYKLQELAEPEVKSCLNYPDTANFDGFSYRVGRSDENYQLLGNVTAKNGFGVKDTMSFSVWFIKKGDSFTIDGIAIDDVRVK